jgi:hypothetical protein
MLIFAVPRVSGNKDNIRQDHVPPKGCTAKSDAGARADHWLVNIETIWQRQPQVLANELPCSAALFVVL